MSKTREMTPSHEEKDKSLVSNYEELLVEEESPSAEEEDKDKAKPSRLEELMKKKGFKDPESLAEAYENLESEFSRRSAELSRLQEAMANFYSPPARSRQTEESEEEDLFDDGIPTRKDVMKIVQRVITDFYNKIRFAERVERARYEIESFRRENPEEFEALKPFLVELSSQRDYESFDELVSEARRKRNSMIDRYKKELLGDLTPDEIERLKNLNAKMKKKVGVSGGGVAESSNEKSAEEKLLDEIFG